MSFQKSTLNQAQNFNDNRYLIKSDFDESQVVIGDVTFSGDIIFNEDLTVNGNIILDDDAYIGIDSDTDLLQLSIEKLVVNGSICIDDDKYLGIDSDTDLMQLSSGVLIVNGNIRIDDNANIGIDSDNDLLQLSSGNFKINGDVGIKTTASKLLHLKESGANDSVMRIERGSGSFGIDITALEANGDIEFSAIDSSSGTGNMFFKTDNGSGAVTNLYLESGGKVSVGFSPPSKTLHIKEPVSADTTLRVERKAGSFGIDITALDANGDVEFNTITSGGGNGNIFFKTDVTNMYLQNGGNIGIGTTSPGTLLEIVDGDLTINKTSGDPKTIFEIGSSEKASIYVDDSDSDRLNITDTNGIILGTKNFMTPIGGFCIKLTNKSGATLTAGQIVIADTTTDDAVDLSAADEMEPIGIVYEDISDDADGWIIVLGIADVAMEDNTAATHGNWVRTSVVEAGYADATNAAAPGLILTHFAEVGHCIESVAAGGAGTHILARCVIHFN